ncbi:MAG: PAS domain-containing sensor histidine kinase [Rhodospirillales bacterium]|nr:PAS domain-containing sensor histidine kinase [Rhodospirillales bacterium]
MLVLLIMAVVSGVATFFAVTGRLPGAVGNTTLIVLLLLDLVLLLCLCVIVARRLVTIWAERRRGLAGARLHARVVSLFGLLAVAPAIVVAIFAAVLFDFGLRIWFSDQVSTAIRNSLAVAEAYLDEHRRAVAGEAVAMARVLTAQGPTRLIDQRRLQALLSQQVSNRTLSEATIFDGNLRQVARGGFRVFADFNPRDLTAWALEQARNGDVVILPADRGASIGALVYLDSFSDSYLYVSRPVDTRILGQIDRSRGAVALYRDLEGQRYDLQVAFAVVFSLVAALLLLVAIWIGLAVANHLTKPVSSLIAAAERVAGGDLTARLPPPKTGDEVASLISAFNRMTEQLQQQRGDLLAVNRQSEESRRFIEAVLSGVSSAVVGLDSLGRIRLANNATETLLGAGSETLNGSQLGEYLPEVRGLVQRARARPGRYAERQIAFDRPDGQTRHLFARVLAQGGGGQAVQGLVCTFEDVTDLLSAQRKAAWADIARRIAHEIKNPLTPIQLSAERLKRKYLKQIDQDPQTFSLCTDTIVRQVADIGRMVDEFSSFARMPSPAMAPQDMGALMKEAVFLQRQAYPEVAFTLDLPEAPLVLDCDARQVTQALTNVLLNAAQALHKKGDTGKEKGRIACSLEAGAGTVEVVVTDNGPGLPGGDPSRLTEPYVTHKARGTGLGLAIAKKIMEEHGGALLLANRPDSGGARVSLSFHKNRLSKARAAQEEAS